MNAPETQVRPAIDSSETTADTAPPPPPPPPAPAGFWKLRHAVTGLVILIALVMLTVRGCGSDEPQAVVPEQAKQPQQAIVVHIPASQVPVQQQATQPGAQQPQPQGYNYAPTAGSNPWSTRSQPHSYGSYQSQSWGRPQPSRPQYYGQPPGGAQYRPQEQPQVVAPARPAPPPQRYYPAAPYDSLSGSSFGTPAYPYGGAYPPGYYSPGMYGVPGGMYAPAWPGVAPGWPGYR